MRTTASRFTAGTAVRLASLTAMLTLTSGCIGVLPLPVTSNHPVEGHKIEHSQAAFIEPGRTTRAQVIARLGDDYSALPMNRAFAYTWELPGGGGVWWYIFAFGEVGVGDGGSWVGGWRGFFVAFDDEDVVTATAFRDLSSRLPLQQHMDRWVAKLPPTPSRVKAGEIARYETPDPAASPGP